MFDGSGQGGQIEVQANIFVAIEDSDILANAESGPGGLVQINSETFLRGLFDQGQATAVGRNPGSFTAFRGNGRVDISADSMAGEPGTVSFPQMEPEQRTSSLPIQLPDQSDRIDSSCEPNSNASRSSFVNTGRGGIPTGPGDLSGLGSSFENSWMPLPEALESEASAQVTQPPSQAIVPQSPNANRLLEASTWRISPTGTMQLLAGKALGKSYPGCLATSAAAQKSR